MHFLGEGLLYTSCTVRWLICMCMCMTGCLLYIFFNFLYHTVTYTPEGHKPETLWPHNKVVLYNTGVAGVSDFPSPCTLEVGKVVPENLTLNHGMWKPGMMQKVCCFVKVSRACSQSMPQST